MPARSDGRKPNQLRPIKMVRGFTRNMPGSVLIESGHTQVLCTACLQEGVPKWRVGGGSGWCTAEYDMLPSATNTRRARNRGRIDGRTQEIQRLIGRSLRAVLSLEDLGENSLLIDCDVIQADGGTRTASITGAYVAAVDAVEAARKSGLIAKSPFVDSVAAVSVGVLGGKALLDLDYSEDVEAEVDMNVVMTGRGKYIEVQGTGEKACFDRDQLDELLSLATRGIRELTRIQATHLGKRKSSRKATS